MDCETGIRLLVLITCLAFTASVPVTTSQREREKRKQALAVHVHNLLKEYERHVLNISTSHSKLKGMPENDMENVAQTVCVFQKYLDSMTEHHKNLSPGQSFNHSFNLVKNQFRSLKKQITPACSDDHVLIEVANNMWEQKDLGYRVLKQLKLWVEELKVANFNELVNGS